MYLTIKTHDTSTPKRNASEPIGDKVLKKTIRDTGAGNEKIINLPSPYGSNQRSVIASVQSDKRDDISETAQLLVLSLRRSWNENCRCRPLTTSKHVGCAS